MHNFKHKDSEDLLFSRKTVNLILAYQREIYSRHLHNTDIPISSHVKFSGKILESRFERVKRV